MNLYDGATVTLYQRWKSRLAVPWMCLAGLVLANACASSPLPPPGDVTWQGGQDRLRAGLGVVAPEAAPSPDVVLMVQAESFFHYRYQPPTPGAARYLGALGAAALEFGPLSVLANSEGMGDLRLRSYDGAAQAYETLLQRWPASRLRPLALYRLGWCYRNVSLDGFPRSSDEAFAEVEREPSAGPLAPLAAEARRVPWKSQDRAVWLSVIPGAGQIYAGRVGNGIVRMTIALALAAAAVLPIVYMAREREVSWQGTAISVAGFVGLQVIYTDSFQTALHDVVDWNERRQREFEQVHPESP